MRLVEAVRAAGGLAQLVEGALLIDQSVSPVFGTSRVNAVVRSALRRDPPAAGRVSTPCGWPRSGCGASAPDGGSGAVALSSGNRAEHAVRLARREALARRRRVPGGRGDQAAQLRRRHGLRRRAGEEAHQVGGGGGPRHGRRRRHGSSGDHDRLGRGRLDRRHRRGDGALDLCGQVGEVLGDKRLGTGCGLQRLIEGPVAVVALLEPAPAALR